MNDQLSQGWKDGFMMGNAGSPSASVPAHAADQPDYACGFVAGHTLGYAQSVERATSSASALIQDIRDNGISVLIGDAAQNFPSIRRRNKK